MNVAKIKAFAILFACFGGLVVLNQNCSPNFLVDGDLFGSNSSSSVDSSEFLAAKAVMKDNCLSCHSGSGGSGRLDYATEQEFVMSGLVSAGSPDQSRFIQRLKNYTGTTTLLKNMPPTGQLSDSDYAVLRRWVGSINTGVSPFACNSSQPVLDRVLTSRVKLLSNKQFLNTTSDFLNVVAPAQAGSLYLAAVSSAIFPLESKDRYPRSTSELTPSRLEAFFKIADRVGTDLTTDPTYGTFVSNTIALSPGTCVAPNATALTDDCGKQLIRNLGLRLYRRPLREDSEFNEVTDFATEFQLNADSRAAVSSLIVRMMMSQNFLFQMEDKETLSSDPKVLMLSSYSIINRLSYTYWNSMPDENLFRMAASANLQDDAKFSQAMDYVLSSSRLESSLKEFADGYFLVRKTPDFDPNVFGVATFNEGLPFDAQMQSAMTNEVEDLVAYTARSGGSFSDLYTTNISFTRYAPLMSLYGVSQAAPATITSTNAVRMPSGTRSGVLTRAALLAEASGRQNVIHRAIRIKRDLLCLPTQPPPPDTTPPVQLTEQEIQTFTQRQKTAHDTGTGVCFSCHQTINPFGYALSKYNGLGFYKQTEPAYTSANVATGAQLPLDSTSDLSGVLGGAGMVNDAVEFSSVVSQRNEAQTCFARNFASYALGRDVDATKEGCRLNKMVNFLKGTNAVKDAMSSISNDKEFRFKRLAD